MTEYNVYCDESCHLEHDGINVMGLGGVWCKKEKIKEINNRIKEIKLRNNVHPRAEVKWSKVGPQKKQLYFDLINYFFDDDDMNFRVLIIPNKSELDHSRYNQTHEEWYYKMYFDMLKAILSRDDYYNIYVDVMNTHSSERVQKLHEVLSNSMFDFSHSIVKKIQPIRSEEVQIMQVVDILLGATVYANRSFPTSAACSQTKKEIIELIRHRSGYSLNRSSLLREEKYNIFMWRPGI